MTLIIRGLTYREIGTRQNASETSEALDYLRQPRRPCSPLRTVHTSVYISDLMIRRHGYWTPSHNLQYRKVQEWRAAQDTERAIRKPGLFPMPVRLPERPTEPRSSNAAPEVFTNRQYVPE